MTAMSVMPLDITLFGWPEVDPTSPLEELGLLVGIPLVVILVVFAISKADAVMKASKHGPGPQASDPVWMGGRARSIMGGAEDEQPEVSEAQPRRELEGSSAPATAEKDAGGASARW